MKTITATQTHWEALAHELGEIFVQRADEHDRSGAFVFENYAELKKHRFFSAMVPTEFGGGGISHARMCDIVRIIGQYCGSTALAFAMHQHLVGATIWKYKHKGMGEATLRRVVEEQLVLVSTGARDWLGSNGEMKKVKGGYLFSGKKHFASQSIGGDVAVTSAPYEDPEAGWQVLHFPVSIQADGVKVLEDWDVMGMRGTGSNTLVFEEVFIPDSAIALARPRNEFHPVWHVVLTVAMPLIMSAYVGIAEKAMEIAKEIGKKYSRAQNYMPHVIGSIYNELIAVQAQWKAMHALTENMDFIPSAQRTVDILSLKTNIADGCIKTVAQCMEGIGGQSFYRKNTLERLFRDVQAAQFHPLPKWEQRDFTGKLLMEE